MRLEGGWRLWQWAGEPLLQFIQARLSERIPPAILFIRMGVCDQEQASKSVVESYQDVSQQEDGIG
jgi:hypothetical protein